jgi:DNA-binding CsgD family transcriptional regulator
MAMAQLRKQGEPIHFMSRAYVRYAEAVIHGRAGRPQDATASATAGDRVLAGFDWFRHFARHLVAGPAVEERWGDPVTWLRESEAFFEERGDAPLAAACRSLLRKAGAPAPRRHRGGTAVPERLRSLGVTAREVEVLVLVSQRMSNAEIGERLFISPRTVEKHIEHLMAKAGVSHRRALTPLAEGLRT